MSRPDYDPRGNKDVGDISEPEYGSGLTRIIEWIFDLVRWLRQREPVTPGDPFTKFATMGRLVQLGVVTENDVLGNDDDQDPDEDAVEPQYVVVHAREMYPSTTAGATGPTSAEISSAKPNIQYVEFSAISDSSAEFQLIMPFGWPGNAFQFRVYWSHPTGATTYGVTWKLQAHSATDQEAIGSDFADGGTVDDDGGTTDTLYITPESTPITISGVNAKAGDLIFLRITRLAATGANDDLNVAARLHAIRFNLGEAQVEFPPDGDPYWASVTLLVRGGTDGGLLINDLSTYADSVTITNYATFDSEHAVFGANPIKGTSIAPSIPAFTSSGAGSRFSRPSGEDLTIEFAVYWEVLEGFDPSAAFFHWRDSVTGLIAELGTTGSSGTLRFRLDTASATNPATLAANTLHWLQLTVVGNTYYLDLNGTQIETGTFPTRNTSGTYSFFAGAYSSGSATGPTTQVWVSPMRVTKGVARARGSVPTAAFPNYAA